MPQSSTSSPSTSQVNQSASESQELKTCRELTVRQTEMLTQLHTQLSVQVATVREQEALIEDYKNRVRELEEKLRATEPQLKQPEKDRTEKTRESSDQRQGEKRKTDKPDENFNQQPIDLQENVNADTTETSNSQDQSIAKHNERVVLVDVNTNSEMGGFVWAALLQNFSVNINTKGVGVGVGVGEPAAGVSVSVGVRVVSSVAVDGMERLFSDLSVCFCSILCFFFLFLFFFVVIYLKYTA